MMPCLGEPTPALLKRSLALSYPESAQAFDIFRNVEAVTARSASCERQGTEPLADSQPAWGNAEVFGSLCDRECLPRFQHAASV